MFRTLVFLFLSVITLGALATPGFAGLGVLLLLCLFGAAFWWVALAVTTRGTPSQAVARTKRHRLLGPGGPDDPFADTPYEGEGRRRA
jgi:hypothetical protein